MILETALISILFLSLPIFSGYYREMIVGELERNYNQIKDMHEKLVREEKED